MTLPASPNPISLSQVNTELERSSTAQISMSDSQINSLFEDDGGTTDQISMSQGHGKTWRKTISLTLSGLEKNANVAISNTNYVAGRTDVYITINALTYSSSTSSPAFRTGTGWTTGDRIYVTNSSYIIGKGGAGGSGGAGSGITPNNGQAGENGGNAILLEWNITEFNNTSGYIYGGGGGGGGGGDVATFGGTGPGGGGGGGGASSSSSLSGWGSAGGGTEPDQASTNGAYGKYETYSGPGFNGAGGVGGWHVLNGYYGGDGGTGGDWGAAGSSGGNATGGFAQGTGGSGGAAGKAVNLNGYSITWTGGNNGTQVKGAVS